MQDFHKLKVWEKAHHLALEVYRVTATFPKGETFGLTSQMRRAAVSVPSNVAEGCGRHGQRELTRFLQVAGGSASELEYQLLLSKELGYISEADHRSLKDQVRQIRRMIAAFTETLRGNGSTAAPNPSKLSGMSDSETSSGDPSQPAKGRL